MKISFPAKFAYRIQDDEGNRERKEKGEKKEKGGKILES